MTRYAMTVDEKLCVTCNACVIACKNENDVPEGAARCWTVQVERGTFPLLSIETRSERCNHCENAPCVTACPTGASHYEEGGIVVVNPDKCVGCKACIVACPYEVRYMHPEGYVDKCTFCIHRVREGLQPACVTVCPTKALTFGDLDDPRSEVHQQLQTRQHKVLKPEEDTRPRLFFLT
ncbi:MAG: 4Fe-4S dicluster domain-containing protein [Polyangiaceae bacterium]|nr:4Fe-4S dicluster domain-containing protein [Polyangiaceae bacterium]MCE7888876.1 4Fe-4S dicluster domain-containing protein [Sorangiineae bacterium PRO1]